MASKKSSAFRPAHHITELLEIAAQAGQQILQVYDTDFSVENKADDSPLTKADIASHKTICAGLQQLTPDIPVLSEESATIPYSQRKTWDCYWLIDPLDGTREFIKKNGEFTVNIALIENNKPAFGIVYIPVTKEFYYASKNAGAFKACGNEEPVPIKTKTTQSDKFTVAGSRSHATEEQTRFFATLGDNTEIITAGSSLKFCLIAEGKIDIYPRFGPTSEWDTAAAQCVVEEAGGIVTDTSLNPLRYNTKESILNPNFLVIADKQFNWELYLSKTKGN